MNQYIDNLNEMIQFAEHDSHITNEIANDLITSGDSRIIEALAKNRNLEYETVCRLSEHHEYKVRASVALNSSCPIDILEKLSKDKYITVVINTALNANTTPEIIVSVLSHNFNKVWDRFNVGGSFRKSIKLNKIYIDNKDKIETLLEIERELL
jgi:hypothetical protein